MNRALITIFVVADVAVIAALIFLRGTGVQPAPAQGRTAQVEARPQRAADESLALPEEAPRAARPKAKAEDGDELRAALEPLRGQVVVSHGTVEEIGRQAGFVLPALAEMKALAAKGDLTPDEKARLLDLQRRYADVLGVLPEIAGFQNNPAEYGSFFRNMVQQSAGLGDAQAQQVDAYMRGRAQDMIAAQLNEGSMPADGQQAWEDRRDTFNEQTVAGLRQILTPPVADKAGVTPQLLEFLETDFDKAAQQPLP